MVYKKLRELRVTHNLSQKELAEKLSLTQSIISNLERNTRRADEDVLSRYATYFQVNVNYFFSELESRTFVISEKDIADLPVEAHSEILKTILELINKYKK